VDNRAEPLLLLLLQGKVAEHKDQLMADAADVLSMLLETPLKDMPRQLLLKVSNKADGTKME
jgi:hypothetical protein